MLYYLRWEFCYVTTKWNSIWLHIIKNNIWQYNIDIFAFSIQVFLHIHLALICTVYKVKKIYIYIHEIPSREYTSTF